MPVVESYDLKNIRELLMKFDYKTSKIMLAGNNILENEDINNQLGEPLSEIKKEKWIRTKYKIF